MKWDFFMMEKAVNLTNLFRIGLKDISQLIIATIIMMVFGTAVYLCFKYFPFLNFKSI
ncbi:hypothetical protein [uncultured Algoriphagus sp.]|uniref:hypothetical protein n=1 Tax=uncultured Algoriphagus sp. TaxID=417365 RepID=UPI0030ED47A8